MVKQSESHTNAELAAQVGTDCATIWKHFHKPAPVRGVRYLGHPGNRRHTRKGPAGYLRAGFALCVALCSAAFVIF